MSMTSSSYFSPELLERGQHSTIMVDGKMYSWGGQRRDMPLVHGSVDRMKLISFVEVFDIPSLSWSRVPTAGIPPIAVMGYSCASINNEVFFFGGCCKPRDCYHNDTFVFNTASKEWSRVLLYANAEMAPMKKIGHCMISFSSDKEDYLLVVGGFGPTPTTTPSHSMYTRVPTLANHFFTNETHILCVSSLPARWIVPVVTGTHPPPLAFFTLNKLPDSNRAILFGGQVIDQFGHHATDDVYIVTYSKDSVDYIKLDSSLEYLFSCPEGRYCHSSTILTANDTHHLLVIGGVGGQNPGQIISDCWILNIDKKKWRKIDLPLSVTNRSDHSVSIFTVSDNCVWVLITGGISNFRRLSIAQGVGSFVTGPDAMMIVELVFSDEWRVTNVWNSEQLVSENSHILSRLGQHVLSDKPHRETGSGSMTKTIGTEELRIRLKEKEKEVEFLREDLRSSRIENEECSKKFQEKEELEEVLKKMLLGKSQELEQLREIKVDQVKSGGKQEKQPGGRDDKLEILREEVETLQDMLIEKDQELTELNMKVKEHRNESELKDVAIQCSSIVPTTDACKIDVGVQFNYTSLETDHLQGVTISSSKLFTVHGDQPQSLIWPGHGFELHFPANTCLPGEECDIMMDAVVGGDFVFPEGVEPVSAIYIISITSKLHMPSLLKIQHCVALDKASKHSRLSFYRALLKEPIPPYNFRRVKGGKFDINSQFGELELPTFCAMVIGKDSPTSSEDESGIGSARSNTGSSCGELEQEDQILLEKKEIEGADNSIMYFGQVFYMKKELNEWEMKFIVVKHIEAFTMYVKSKLKQYEENVQVNIRFSTSHIELVLDREEAAKGWSIEPYSEPLVVSLKFARGFGYEKEVTVPPTCMVAVYGDNSITDYVRRLHHPVFLKGALIGDGIQEPKIYIKRTMTEKDAQYPPSLSEGPSVQIQQNPASIDTVQASAGIDEIINCIKEEITKKFPALQTLFDEDSLKVVAAEMLAAGIIAHHVANNPSFSAIINGFLSSFSFFGSMEEIEDWCNRFLNALHNVGGPFVVATNNLKKELKSSLMKKCNVKFNI